MLKIGWRLVRASPEEQALLNAHGLGAGGCSRCVATRHNIILSIKEALGFAQHYYGEHLQDKWVTETVFPGLHDGYFVDVGSGDGIITVSRSAVPCRHNPKVAGSNPAPASTYNNSPQHRAHPFARGGGQHPP